MRNNGADRPSISILIAAHNEAADIEECLRSVLACSGPDEFEVIVVDDASTDDTAAIVQRVADSDARVTLYSLARGGKGRALNYAVRHAHGATCLSTDADCRVPSTWVSGMASELERLDVVFGTTRFSGNAQSDGGVWQNILESKRRVKWGPGAPEVFTPVGQSLGFKRAVWEDIGGFAETTSEDADFAERAIRHGWLVSNSTEDHARILTRGPDTYHGFLRQSLRWRNWKETRDLLKGSWPRRERVLPLLHGTGVSLMFLLWTVWCIMTGNWTGLGLGILAVVGADSVPYGIPLMHFAARPDTRMWPLYFLGWVICTLLVRLCEIPYLVLRLVRGEKPVWERAQ
ncbi:MAG: glycosyltransferase [Chloroflexota bacterium]